MQAQGLPVLRFVPTCAKLVPATWPTISACMIVILIIVLVNIIVIVIHTIILMLILILLPITTNFYYKHQFTKVPATEVSAVVFVLP